MLSLILLIVFGLGMAVFATQNTHTASIVLANYRFDQIPTYLVVVLSMLFGIFVSWLLSLVSTVSSSLTIHGKDGQIKDAKRKIADLQKQVHTMEVENARLAGENTVPVVVQEK